MTSIFKQGDKVVLVALSDPRNINIQPKINRLVETLENMGLIVSLSSYLYQENTSEEIIIKKAKEFNSFFADNKFKAIFDISGGDSANAVLEYLDYNLIKQSDTIFFGYSDLTVIINALHTKSKKYSYLYQVMNILDSRQESIFIDTFFKNNNSLLSHKDTSKTIVGGNIRCFLKLASTEFFPNLDGSVLLLEAMSGNLNRAESYFRQLKQMKAFEKVDSIILGQFTELDKTIPDLDLVSILKKYTPNHLTIIRDKEIGHSPNSKAVIIGKSHTI
ncbi:MAG: LD-carboxypeptidase [Gemella sp.]|nr:LD-carboxypeptidase [Gemella sp.]